MIKKTITYTDYNDNTVTSDFYFNLNKVELTELEVSIPEGLSEHIKKVIDTKDAKAMIALYKMLILKSYGQKEKDGNRFIKSNDATIAFEQSPAFEELFMELIQNEKAAEEFMKGILPKQAN